MSFEDLRKRARQLESEIDGKLVSLSKFAANYGSSSGKNSDIENAPLISEDDVYEQISSELVHLLSSLTEINECLNSAQAAGGSSTATAHTLKRHRDILQDYTHEFHRTNNTIKSRKEREQLLNTSRSDGRTLAGLSKRDLYLKEGEHIANSERMIDEQISIAIETRDHLRIQRDTFKTFQTKLNDLANKFPLINTLMTKISIRKRRDVLILGSVIGVCLTFMLWWMFG